MENQVIWIQKLSSFYKNIFIYFDVLSLSVLINKNKFIILSSTFYHLIFYLITFDDVLVFSPWNSFSIGIEIF